MTNDRNEAELAALALRIVKRDTEGGDGRTATDRIIDADIQKYNEAVRKAADGLTLSWYNSPTGHQSFRYRNLKGDVRFLEENLAAAVKAVQELIGELKAVSRIVDGSEAHHD